MSDMELCHGCKEPLDKSNSAHIRCVNTKCSEVKKCHCCDEPLGPEISKLECYSCNELHCLYGDKDSFVFMSENSQVCETCHEIEQERDRMFDGWESEPVFEYPITCQMNDCLGLLSYEDDYATCLECKTKWHIDEFLP